jgi:hypothetical protein
MPNTAEMRGNEREALEAYLGDQFSFTVPEAAKIMNRSAKWVRKQARTGKLRAVWLNKQQIIMRPTIVLALMEGF